MKIPANSKANMLTLELVQRKVIGNKKKNDNKAIEARIRKAWDIKDNKT